MGGVGRFTYPRNMSESPETVDLHFNVAVAGKARRGQDVRGVERTPYVDGLLEHGIASLIGGAAGEPDPEPRTGEGDLTSSGTASDVSGPDPAADRDAAGTTSRVPSGSDTTTPPPAEPAIGSSRRKATDDALRAQAAQDDPTPGVTPAGPGDADQAGAGAG